jgi:HNH endonuclease
MKCIYCVGRRGDERMTLEHIWPQALGGRYAPNLFKTPDVCKRCNELAGQWVDGAFLKSPLITHETAIAARRYLDPARPSILPLIYLGIDEEFPAPQGELCERWIGPAGEQIYHVHQADDDKWFGYAGGDFFRRKREDVGRAYIGLTASHPYWLVTGIGSFIAYLEPARLFLVTVCEGLPYQLVGRFTPESMATSTEAAELDWIRNRPTGGNRPFRMPLDLRFADRFLAKLALGLGYNIIGSGYSATAYADQLRKLLWIRDPSDVSEIEVLGTDYWQADQFDSVSKTIGLTGAWTILLRALREGLLVSVCTPGGRTVNMGICNDASLLSRPTIERCYMGELYFAVPQRKAFIGPVSLAQYLSYRSGTSVLPAIAELEALRVDESMLPPLQWDSGTDPGL